MKPVKLLMFAGSARRDSLNKKLAAAAAAEAESLGAEVELVDPAAYPIPLYDGDLEAEAFPDNVRLLREKLVAADGFLIASPEYNGSITPLLKNLIDWTSRPQEGLAEGLVAYRGKTAALVATSPGALGGLRGLVHVRAILSGIGVHVVPGDVAVGNGFQAFHEDGGLIEEGTAARLRTTVQSLIRTAAALRD
ncbi:MAG: NADPH-dependent FMN reductase [Planctomycetota bacterium]|jgi:NAD(P)H-dependent FMN reductase